MTVADPYEKRSPATNPPRHKRPNGQWSADYFCMNCGAPMAEQEPGHGANQCNPNYELVNELRRINLW